MYTLRLDVGGDFEIKMPRTEADIIALGAAYVKFEATLSPADALHDISGEDIRVALVAAQTASAAQVAAEADRAIAAAQFQQTYRQTRPLLDRVITHLKSRHADNLADLEQWGLKTKARSRGVVVMKPANPLDWLNFLNAYLEQEGRRPAAERIANPSFAELTELAEMLNSTLKQREYSLTQRQISVAARRAAAQHLLNLLHIAAVTRVVKRYQGRVSPELGNWGYRVVARKGL